MNEPAQKEPSMDEILSSIRQIIADDDAAGTAGGNSETAVKAAEPEPEQASSPQEREAEQASPQEPEATSEPEAPSEPEPPTEEPLALSQSQIVDEEAKSETQTERALDEAVSDAESVHGTPPPAPSLVVPDDVAFDGDSEPAAEGDAKPAEPEDDSAPSPLPDPSLSGDLAGQLLAPTADAVTRHAFGQLNSVALAGRQQTVEDLIREMLRPMLKGWLDENLPGMVERMVQREIERISRGR